jgi:hypothetical protein
MPAASQPQVRQVFEQGSSARLGQISEPDVPANHLRDLDVDRIRGVEAPALGEDPIGDLEPRGSQQEQLERRRRVGHDQRESRSRRTTSTTGTLGRTRGRSRSRARSSSGVGREVDSPRSAGHSDRIAAAGHVRTS